MSSFFRITCQFSRQLHAVLILIFLPGTLYNKNVGDIVSILALAFLFAVIRRIIIATGCLSYKTKGRYSYQMCAASQQLGAWLFDCLTFPDQRGAVLYVYISTCTQVPKVPQMLSQAG